MGSLASGVYRFGKSSTYHKKAIYKFSKKTTPKKAVAKTPIFKEKPIGGAKNGGTRKRYFSGHARKLRSTLAPGVIAILLAGVHKGKRVIVLKQLATGLLLITGPHKLNGCPLRRVNQRYLLATTTKVDVSGVSIPENIDDKYFARAKAEKSKEGDIFSAKKEEYKPSEERKKDQATVDASVLAAIKAHPEGAVLKQYLKATFALSKGEYPHKMTF